MVNLHEEGNITDAPLNKKGIIWNTWEAEYAISKKTKKQTVDFPVLFGETLKLKTPEATVLL